MGAARRWCVRAVLLAGMTSVAISACQFPAYHVADGNSGTAGSGAGSGASGAEAAGAPLGGMTNGGVDSAGAGDGGDNGGAGAGAGAGGSEIAPGPPCPAQSCVPTAPTGWSGPVAFWEGKAGTAPDCPPGYGDPLDSHRDLLAPAGPCTCTCAAEGQVCDTTVRLYTDQSCAVGCDTVSPGTCSAVTGDCHGSQGSLRADAAPPSGGHCEPTVSDPAAAAWQSDARICQPTRDGFCDDENQVCAPTPPPTFFTQLCVTRRIPEGRPLPACPSEYPDAQAPLYEKFSDDRGCSECTCGNVTGGSCAGSVVLGKGGDCTSGVTPAYQLGSGCAKFDLGSGPVEPTRVGFKYTVTPGTCSVVSQPKPIGSAAPSGQITVVCCQN